VKEAFPDFTFDLLKMDCEGCEYDIIMNSYNEVRQFKELIIEAHPVRDRKITELLLKLRKDYECNEAINKNLNAMLYCHERIT
jgi:hypothetical protein